MAPILNHGLEMHQGQRLWMLAGTGEGPVLAASLLRQGWRLRVSLVTKAAALAYGDLEPQGSAGRLELQVGALAGATAVEAALAQAQRDADPFVAVLDATHPFARRISRDLASACTAAGVPLLRLVRPRQQAGSAAVLNDLRELGQIDLQAQHLLLALGSRQLAAAVRFSAGAVHHARVLPSPQALQLALAAGLAPERLAVLRPTADFAIEAALVRRWGIGTIVCRQSGGSIEAGWRQISERCGCRLLLLARPDEPPGVESLSMEALQRKLEQLAVAASDG